MSAPKEKKNTPASGGSPKQKPARKKGKLLQLDDLIPKKDVSGGRQLLFGVTDVNSTTNNPKKEK